MHLYTIPSLGPEIQALKFQNHVYIGIPKNALITHSNVFLDAGWQRIGWPELLTENKIEDLKFFAHIQNPHVRHTKGIAEYMFRLWSWREECRDNAQSPETIDDILCEWITDESNGEAVSLMVQSIFDQHTIPVCTLLKDIGVDPNVVTWIPMDHPQHSTEVLTNNYLKENNIDLEITKEQRAHIATDSRRRCYRVIHDMKLYSLVQAPTPFGNGMHYERHFIPAVMRDDIELYLRVMNQYGLDLLTIVDKDAQEHQEQRTQYARQISEEYIMKHLGKEINT